MTVQPYAALDHVTAPTLVESDGHVYFMCGAPIPTVGWVVVNAVDHACVDKQQDGLSSAFDEIVDATRVVYDAITSRSTIIVLGVILFVAIFATVSALTVTKHIVDPLELSTKRVKSLSGDNLLFTMEDDYRTGDEVEDLAESFAVMSAKTLGYVDEVKRVTAQQERMSAELRVATDIQANQLPSTFPAFPDRTEFDLFALMNPVKEVGGDFYDFFFVDHDHIALLIADVSSKGVPAALFMMVSRLLLKSHIQNGESLSEALSDVNDRLSRNNNAAFFATVWAAVIDLRSGEGTAVNAGHEHPQRTVWLRTHAGRPQRGPRCETGNHTGQRTQKRRRVRGRC